MKLSAITFCLSIIVSQHSVADFSAIIEQELTVDTGLHGGKFETIFQPEWNVSINEEVEMTFIARARFDTYNNLGPEDKRPQNYSGINGSLISGSHGDLSIREWYIDTEVYESFWRLGKQQVVWGQADGLKVLDVVNPQSFREFILDDFEDSRIPLWMLNIEIPIGDEDSLQILWIPDLTYHEFAEANTTFQITSPLFVPSIEDGLPIVGFAQRKPTSILSDSDVGLRYSKFYDGWDLTFNYLYHYHDSPILYQQFSGAGATSGISIDSRYERNHLIGATASNVFGDFTLRTEVGYNSDTFHQLNSFPSTTSSSTISPPTLDTNGIFQSAEFSSVIGLDWQGLQDVFMSVQWFQSHLFDYDKRVVRPQMNNIVSFLYKQTFQNETIELNILSLYGFDQQDSSIQLELSYMLEDNLKIWIGSDRFSGSTAGLFGQFDQQDQIKLGFEWGI